LARRADALTGLEVAEQGKTRFEAYGVILALIHLLRYYCRKAPRLLRPRRVFPLFGVARVNRIVREPHGVVGVISPWNYPLTLSLESVLAALICGNGVVLKPSEHTPLVGEAIRDLLREAALPSGLFGVVNGDRETGQALIDAGMDKLVFIGSVEGGRQVAARAARNVTPCTLELGGKDAAIVLEDADLPRAARGIAWGATLNSGQACLGIERVYVVDSVADRFLEQLCTHMQELRVGPGAQDDNDIAAITTEEQLARIQAHVDDAVAKGARCLCGGKRLLGAGRFFAPTVLVDVTADMLITHEETFGPVLTVEPVQDSNEAVEFTNAVTYGLTCSIWTRDLRRGRELAARIRVGDVAINEHGAPAGLAEIPWGGIKCSGYGKTRGQEGLLEMVVTKHVSWPRVQTRRELFWYPYTKKGTRALRRGIVLLYGTWRQRWAALLGR
jgi:acyl-CoA reductase-like NAD-dependent aldehyde dehydrogenase